LIVLLLDPNSLKPSLLDPDAIYLPSSEKAIIKTEPE